MTARYTMCIENFVTGTLLRYVRYCAARCHAVTLCVSAEPRRYCTPLRVLLVYSLCAVRRHANMRSIDGVIADKLNLLPER